MRYYTLGLSIWLAIASYGSAQEHRSAQFSSPTQATVVAAQPATLVRDERTPADLPHRAYSLSLASSRLRYGPSDAKHESGQETNAESPGETDVIWPPDVTTGATREQRHSFGLEELQAIAVSNHPQLARAQALVQSARAKAYQATRKENPHVGIDFQQLGSGGRAEQYGVTVQQLYVPQQKRTLNQAIALHQADEFQKLHATEELRIRTATEQSFWHVHRTQKQQQLASFLVQVNDRAVARARQLLQADEVARTDVLLAEIELAQAQTNLAAADQEIVAAWRSLEAICGIQLYGQAHITGDLFALPSPLIYEEYLQKMYAESPLTGQLLARINRARCELQRQRVAVRPNVAFAGLLNWQDNGINGNADAGVAVSLPVPFHDKNRGNISAARQELLAAEADLQQLQREFAAKLAPAFSEYLAARQRVITGRDILIPKATEALELTQAAYDAGETPYRVLQAALETFTDLHVSYLAGLETVRHHESSIRGLLIAELTLQ